MKCVCKCVKLAEAGRGSRQSHKSLEQQTTKLWAISNHFYMATEMTKKTNNHYEVITEYTITCNHQVDTEKHKAASNCHRFTETTGGTELLTLNHSCLGWQVRCTFIRRWSDCCNWIGEQDLAAVQSATRKDSAGQEPTQTNAYAWRSGGVLPKGRKAASVSILRDQPYVVGTKIVQAHQDGDAWIFRASHTTVLTSVGVTVGFLKRPQPVWNSMHVLMLL